MERHEIEVLLTLAQELHFGKTALRLGVAQSRVSQTVAKLERRIGAPLFERTSRRVSLTPIGRQLATGIGPAHLRMQEEIAKAIAAARGVTGRLRLGFTAAFSADLLVTVADVLSANHPGTDVQLREVWLDSPFDLLRDHEVDMQMSELPVEETDITVGPVLIRQSRALLVSAANPLARRPWVDLEDLADTTLLSVGGSSPKYWQDWHFPRTTPAGTPIPHGEPMGSWDEVLSLVRADKGVTPVARVGSHYFGRPGLAFVPFRDAPPIEYALLWPTALETARVRAFAQIALELVASLGGPDQALSALRYSDRDKLPSEQRIPGLPQTPQTP